MCVRAQAGDVEAMGEIIVRSLRLVSMLAPRYSGAGVAPEDLLQEGIFGLHRAALKFDPDRDAIYSTFAVHWIRSFLQIAVADAMELPSNVYALRVAMRRRFPGRRPTVDQVAESYGVDEAKARKMCRIYEQAETFIGLAPVDVSDGVAVAAPDEFRPVEDRDLVRSILDRLAPSDRTLVELRVGLGGGAGLDFPQIAELVRPDDVSAPAMAKRCGDRYRALVRRLRKVMVTNAAC